MAEVEPDWNEVRLAVHGKQVVVLFGSDQGLLKATLKNVKDGRKGLGEAKRLEAFAERHFSRAMALRRKALGKRRGRPQGNSR